VQVFWCDILECSGTFITSRFSKLSHVQETDILSREVMVSPQIGEIVRFTLRRCQYVDYTASNVKMTDNVVRMWKERPRQNRSTIPALGGRAYGIPSK
jgi:hypothetical protein